jgi:hypothetical protein
MRVNAALPSLPELQQQEQHHPAAFQLTSTADDAACLELKAVVADCFKVNRQTTFLPVGYKCNIPDDYSSYSRYAASLRSPSLAFLMLTRVFTCHVSS